MRNGIRCCLLTAGVGAGVCALGISVSAQTGQGPAPGVAERVAQRAALSPPGPTPRTADGHPDLSEVWHGSATGVIDLRDRATLSAVDRTARAEGPSFQRWALEKRKRIGPFENATPALLCEPLGAVRILSNPYPIQIVQTPKIVVILSELGTTYRRIWIDGRPHQPDPDPLFNGDAIGHWEGDTLVVSVKALDVRQWVGEQGFFISDVAHLTERFTRPDSNTLLYQYTVDDPKVLTKPWTSPLYRFTIARTPMVEYYCTNERDSDVFLKEGRTYISPSGLDERFFDEDEYQELKKQFPD